MTFTYKLAKRLARLRLRAWHLPAVLICLAGCAAGEPTNPVNTNPPTDDGPVVLNPRSVTIEGPQHVLFRAFQSMIPGSGEVTSIEWTTTGGSITSQGSFSSAQDGEFKVVGRRKGNPHNRPDTSTVIVVPPQPQLEGLLVTPRSATVGMGLQQQFTAVGRLTDGTLVSVGVTWTATGGTIDPSGVYTAGTSSGTYGVTATHTTTGKTATATVTIPAATLTGLRLSPASVSIPVGTSVQFSAMGTLSDGSTASVPVVYSATGGTISFSGLYTAGSATGTYRVTGTAQDGKVATSTVTITTAPPPPPPTSGGLWRDEQFSAYTSDEHWRSDPYDWMVSAPNWYNQQEIHIDRSVTYDGHPTLRYDWPGDDGTGNECSTDLTHAAAYKTPQVHEVWIEIVHKFATTFNTNVRPAGYCGQGQYKFVLPFLKGVTGRIGQLLNGTWGYQWWDAHPSQTSETAYGTNCSGLGWNCRSGYGTGQEVYRQNVPTTAQWDGQWHVYRFHIKMPDVQGQTTGLIEQWIDGKQIEGVYNQNFISRIGEFSNLLAQLNLGGNSNSGTSQATSEWWGRLRIWTASPGW
jgi:Bacterial Ig-like domain (group 2)